MKNRDATKQARGFSYQRQYCLWLFFKSINTDIKEIIEEGKLDGLTYEDITTINNNDEYITYQIKYHTKKMCFNRSNKDLFKTIANVNNLQPKLKKVYFIVAKINDILDDTFDDSLNDWKNENISSFDIYNKIINLDEDDNKKVEIYKECLTFLKTNPDDKILYLNKIKLIEGFTYDELIIKINDIIKSIFNIYDDKIIYFIKYYVFELFDKNWFNENIPLNINDIYSDIKLKISNISLLIENNELFNNMYLNIIEKIKKYIQIINEGNNNIYLSNLLNEIKYFINQFYNNFEVKHCILLMKILHNLNKKLNNINNEIIEIYKITNKHLCALLFNIIKTAHDTLNEKNYNIICSITYYYKHNIKKSIDLSKSNLKYILTIDDKLFIKKYLKVS
jgi:hypothetical protein